MRAGPSRVAEIIVALLVPPACREEVTGDLHERYRSPLRYAAEALQTVPLLILSRMRSVTDPQLLLLQAFVFYICFLGADKLNGGAVLRDAWGLVRCAIPAVMALLGLVLADTYSNPAPRPPHPARSPLAGVLIAAASQGLLAIGRPEVAIPRLTLLYGCGMSLLLSSSIRLWFPPFLRPVSPGQWMQQAAEARDKGLSGTAAALAAVGIGILLLLVMAIAAK